VRKCPKFRRYYYRSYIKYWNFRF